MGGTCVRCITLGAMGINFHGVHTMTVMNNRFDFLILRENAILKVKFARIFVKCIC